MSPRARWVPAAAILVAVIAGCTPPATTEPAPAGVAADQPVELFLGLTRNQDGLQRLAAVTDPTARPGTAGGPIPLTQVTARFGSSQATRDAVAAHFGAQAVTFSATGAFARLVLPLSDAEREFALGWQVDTVGDIRVLTATGDPTVPDALQGQITEVVPRDRVLPGPAAGGSGTGSPAAPDTGRPDAAASSTPGTIPDGGVVDDPTSCDQARRAGAALVAATGLDAVHDSGHTGAGARVAIVAVAGTDAPLADTWLDCIGHPPVTVRQLPTLATPAPVAPDVEGQLDLAAMTVALPGLTDVTMVQAGPADWVGDALATALTDPAGQPAVIASSVVFCERRLTPQAIRLAEFVLAAAVAAGTLVVAASGDQGSSACAPADTGAAVAYPASSPNVLAIGGVNGSRAVWSRPADRVAGGGGSSSVFAGRRLPDLVALASAPDLPPIPVCTPDCAWRRYSGTSFAAPFVGGALVAVAQARASRGTGGMAFGLGGVDRAVAPAAVVDVVAGDNDLYSVGCCQAGTGFDEASGYGVPRFGVLAGG